MTKQEFDKEVANGEKSIKRWKLTNTSSKVFLVLVVLSIIVMAFS